jgi:hypothetical protein
MSMGSAELNATAGGSVAVCAAGSPAAAAGTEEDMVSASAADGTGMFMPHLGHVTRWPAGSLSEVSF